ncbi:MAG TPA: POTRA domain-containing protein, partial [Kofleriaceae bacterium]|nr:POTRA domain-containing protein [Kofleriaceae bacterium]
MVKSEPTRIQLSMVMVALYACGSSTAPPPGTPSPDEPHEGKRIASVKIIGNDALGDSDIAGGLAMRGPTGIVFKEHTRYDPALAQLDRDRIESFYARRGYFAAEVTDLDVRPCGGSVGLWFTVIEGQPSVIADVTFAGAGEAVGREQLRGLTSDLRRGKILVHQRYLDAKRVIARHLQERGYARAEVDGEVIVDRDQRMAMIAFQVRPGPLVRFGRTHVEGAGRIPESAV